MHFMVLASILIRYAAYLMLNDPLRNTESVHMSYKFHLKPEWMPDELNERLSKQIEMDETEIIPEPLNQIVFRIVSI